MENIKRLPREEAVLWAAETLDEMLGRGGCKPDDEQVRALYTLQDCADNVSDRWAANIYLIIVGVICSVLGVVLGSAGAYHAMRGNPEAVVVGKYAAGFFVAGLVSFAGVRK